MWNAKIQEKRVGGEKSSDGRMLKMREEKGKKKGNREGNKMGWEKRLCVRKGDETKHRIESRKMLETEIENANSSFYFPLFLFTHTSISSSSLHFIPLPIHCISICSSKSENVFSLHLFFLVTSTMSLPLN